MQDEETVIETTTEAEETVVIPDEVTTETAPKPAITESDWRVEAMKGFADEDGRKAGTKFLKSYNDIGSLAAGALKNSTKLREGGLVEPLGEEASANERREFLGKIGYTFPDDKEKYSLGLDESEFNTGLDAKFNEMMTEKGVPKEYAGIIGEFAKIAQEYTAEQRGDIIERQEQSAIDAIEEMWPTRKERQENIESAKAFTAFAFEKDWDEMKELQLSDGTRLGDYPDFVKGFAKMGRLLGESHQIDLPSANEAAADADEQLTKLMNEHYGKPSYQTDAIQNKINHLTAIVARRKQAA
jgi:hypothetical protein